MRKLIVVLMAAVLIAGCTGQSLPWNTGTGETNMDAADLIVASNEATIPSQPNADTDFAARFTVKNQHSSKRAQNVGVWIYDTGKCEVVKIGGLEPVEINEQWAGLSIETAGGTQHITEFAPGQQELIKLDMKAPTSSQIAGLPYTCPIRYRIAYDFEASSAVTADIMAPDRLKQIEAQTGERPVYSRTLNVGPGPIRILMEPVSTLPVESKRTLQLEITVKNEGTGEYASVEPGKLTLNVPTEFTPVLDAQKKMCGGYFSGSGGVYTNYRKIELMEKQASPITCEFTAPDVAVEKEYTITAALPYAYSYFGQEISVPITP